MGVEGGGCDWSLFGLSGNPTKVLEAVVDFTPSGCALGALVGSGLEVDFIIQRERVDTGQSEFVDLSPDSTPAVGTEPTRVRSAGVGNHVKYVRGSFQQRDTFDGYSASSVTGGPADGLTISAVTKQLIAWIACRRKPDSATRTSSLNCTLLCHRYFSPRTGISKAHSTPLAMSGTG